MESGFAIASSRPRLCVPTVNPSLRPACGSASRLRSAPPPKTGPWPLTPAFSAHCSLLTSSSMSHNYLTKRFEITPPP